MELDKDLVRELAALLDETGLSEIEIGEDTKHIRVARGGAPVVAPGTAAAQPAGGQAAPAPAEDAEPAPQEPEDYANHPGAVTSPMVGTVYVAPDPNSAPFVKVGDEVREGQTVLIVEAMKTMNPIPAPKAGRIARVLVDNAQPVEYDEVLMIIE